MHCHTFSNQGMDVKTQAWEHAAAQVDETRDEKVSEVEPSERYQRARCDFHGLKIPFGILSLWPPVGFILFLLGNTSDVTDDVYQEAWAAIVIAGIPLFFGTFIPCFIPCTREGSKTMPLFLFWSDVILSLLHVLAGVIWIILCLRWPRDWMGIALRVIVDVFGMALIHLCGCLAFFFS
jgi:hypothetical protein